MATDDKVVIYPMQASGLSWLLNQELDRMGPVIIIPDTAAQIRVTFDNGEVYLVATDGATRRVSGPKPTTPVEQLL